MPDEDHSNPFIAASPNGIMNALLKLENTTGKLTGVVEKLEGEYTDLRRENSRFATRDELHEHAQQCPGNIRATRTRRPTSGNVPKLNLWQTAQQRLGVILSVLTLLSIVGGAWWWSVNAASVVQKRLVASEKKQQKRDHEIKAEVRKNLREVLKAIRDEE